jgi:hypothetical protein
MLKYGSIVSCHIIHEADTMRENILILKKIFGSTVVTNLKCGAVFFLCVSGAEAQSSGAEHFFPLPGDSTEIWRLTSDPKFRHWINYHNTKAWSPDGRYIAIEESVPHSYQSGPNAWRADPSTKQVYLYDLEAEELVHLGSGEGPRWANHQNWLFYIEFDPFTPNTEAKTIRYDVNNHSETVIASGFVRLDETDSLDEWLYARAAVTGEIFRIPILSAGEPENITGEVPLGRIMVPNPVHPVIFYRDDERDKHGLAPFGGTRYFSNLDGSNVRMAFPNLQKGHTAWSGDGTYLLTSGPLLTGRRWDEPFPSNLHILAWNNYGDINSCGHDGRWVNSSGSIGAQAMADLRSGDVRIYLSKAGSYMHNSTAVNYGEGSNLYDNDAKCSPDGTKVVFVSNYDLKNGPVTKVKGYIPDSDSVPVLSTDGFPEQGRLSIGKEVVGYTGKTALSFLGITRNLYHTTSASQSGLTAEMIDVFPERESDKAFRQEYKLKQEQIEQLKIVTGEVPSGLSGTVTSFDMRSIPEEQRGTPPARFIDPDFPEPDSPLIWQNQTDVYVAVVRKPDSPYLRINSDGLELIPGESHEEIRGYHLLKNGARFTDDLLQPGTTINLTGPGAFSAVAAEWSGLESPPSHTVVIQNDSKLDVLTESPLDFKWTRDRWLSNGEEVSAVDAQSAAIAIREIVHHYDGVIHRESHQLGQMIQRDDLNQSGIAIRRRYYQSNQLIRQEYHGGGWLRTTELFDDQGYIVEVIQHGSGGSELSHTLFENGTPVEHTGGSLMRYAPDGAGNYQKSADNWVTMKVYSN